MCFYKHENGIKFILTFFITFPCIGLCLAQQYMKYRKKKTTTKKKNDTILCFDILDFHFTEVLCTLSREKKSARFPFKF